MGIPYEPFRPDNIYELLEIQDALIILDEIHAIVPVNDRVSPSCDKHPYRGLCYHLSELFRQVGKKEIDTYVTCQTDADCYAHARRVMNVTIYCELQHYENGRWIKCLPQEYVRQKCPAWHWHRVKQRYEPSSTPWNPFKYFYIEPYYDNYNSFEIVEGWLKKDDETSRKEHIEPVKKSIGTDNIKGW